MYTYIPNASAYLSVPFENLKQVGSEMDLDMGYFLSLLMFTLG